MSSFSKSFMEVFNLIEDNKLKKVYLKYISERPRVKKLMAFLSMLQIEFTKLIILFTKKYKLKCFPVLYIMVYML